MADIEVKVSVGNYRLLFEAEITIASLPPKRQMIGEVAITVEDLALILDLISQRDKDA